MLFVSLWPVLYFSKSCVKTRMPADMFKIQSAHLQILDIQFKGYPLSLVKLEFICVTILCQHGFEIEYRHCVKTCLHLCPSWTNTRFQKATSVSICRINVWAVQTAIICKLNYKTSMGSSELCMLYLVRVRQSGMREVERRDEQTDTLTLHPITIQVICDDPGHKVLASAWPAVEGESERLVGLWVVDKTMDGFQNHRLSQMLPMELCLKVPRQAWTQESTGFKISWCTIQYI